MADKIYINSYNGCVHDVVEMHVKHHRPCINCSLKSIKSLSEFFVVTAWVGKLHSAPLSDVDVNHVLL